MRPEGEASFIQQRTDASEGPACALGVGGERWGGQKADEAADQVLKNGWSLNQLTGW